MMRRGAVRWSLPLHISHPHPALLSPPEENPAWLPLYGSVCCRLVAQPLCMIQPTASGTLRVQVRGPEEWKGSGRRQRRARSPRDQGTIENVRSGWRKKGHGKMKGG